MGGALAVADRHTGVVMELALTFPERLFTFVSLFPFLHFLFPPGLPVHLPRELLVLHAQSLLLAVLPHHHRLQGIWSKFLSPQHQFWDFLAKCLSFKKIVISPPAASCSPLAEHIQSLREPPTVL